MEAAGFSVRPAREGDFEGWFALFEAVAAEGRWIGREFPVDRDESHSWFVGAMAEPDGQGAFVAEAAGNQAAGNQAGNQVGKQVGQLVVRAQRGLGDIGMLVAADWRGRGVGSALLAAGVGWAREHDLYKLTLQLWPHNEAAHKLYLKVGFVDEGHLRRHYRRRNGELWDALVMGMVLDETSPGAAE
jgi:RimJ/RimL family protein N-acetyltransferase